MLKVYVWIMAHRPHLSRETGQDLIEYAMLGGLIAIAIIGAGVFFQPAIASMASGIGACIDFTSGTPCEPF